MAVVPSTFRRRWLRPQDFVWLFLFSALALVSTEPTPQEIALVFSLGLFQVIEPKVGWFSTDRGNALVHPDQTGLVLPADRLDRGNQQHLLRHIAACRWFPPQRR